MFPLNTVLYPGVSVPLHVFEDRYRALVHHLVRIPDPSRRLFGSVAVREGYELHDHEHRSLHHVGVRLQLTDVDPHADGTFDIVAVGRDRIRLDRLLTTGPYLVGEVSVLTDAEEEIPDTLVQQAKATYMAYRHVVCSMTSDPLRGELPSDPAYLAWAMAAGTPLPTTERQMVLEANDTASRLQLLIELLRYELSAMNAVASLPALDVTRIRWSPN